MKNPKLESQNPEGARNQRPETRSESGSRPDRFRAPGSAFRAGVCLLLSALRFSAFSQTTAFTYQGRLNDGAAPASGLYDLRFALFDADSGGAQQGNTHTNEATVVSNGLFTVPLDFGNQFPGADRWLEIGVRTNGAGAFTILSPRQSLTPAPYAVHSATAGTAATASSVAAANISGTIPLAQLPASVVTNGASGVNISGSFTGNGTGVTNVDLRTANSLGAISFATNYGTFTLASSPSVGDGPFALTSADVNGDGRADLITANNGDSTLTVLTNNGSGGFALSSSPSVGASPYSLTSGDVNGDGWVDLVSRSGVTNLLTVLTNDGSGSFVLASSPDSGGLGVIYSLISADVSGDGWVDLICANEAEQTLSVLTNNGSGDFAIASSPGAGSHPTAVTSADVNGDGLLDLISANFIENTLTVFTNGGSGSFVLSSSPGVANYPQSVTAVDVNGDGKVDLVGAHNGANTLTVLTNSGSGEFAIASLMGLVHPSSVTAADVNGDGRADLISGNGGGLTLLTNNGNGGFVVASLPGVGGGPEAVAAVDVNGDGRVDLISANVVSDTLSVLFNTAVFTGSFAGNGSGLTSLNASQLSSGTVPLDRLPASVVTNGASAVSLAGTFTGDGSGLANLNAGNLSSGVLPDTRLSANVAQRSGGNTFGGDQFVNGALNVNSPGFSTATTIIRARTNDNIPFAVQNLDGNNLLLVLTNAGGQVNIAGPAYAQSFTSTSDRNAKENFTPVSPTAVLDRVLSLPISRWNFKTDAATPHLGPMAQDFHAAFGLGVDDKHIATVDADGVALAAIQGLNQKLERENAELKARLEKLERMLNDKHGGAK